MNNKAFAQSRAEFDRMLRRNNPVELETCKLLLRAYRAGKCNGNMSFMQKTECGRATEYVFFSPTLYKTIYIIKKDGGCSVRIDGMMHTNFNQNHLVAMCAERLVMGVEENKRREKAESMRENEVTRRIIQAARIKSR